VVAIFQENRTPDNLFHGLRDADIANSGVDSAGNTVELRPIALANTYDLSHEHKAFVQMYDHGRMDGANKIALDCAKGVNCTAPVDPQFMYVEPDDVQPYFDLAENYTFGDRMFQTNQGPSFPAHQFITAGTSALTATSDLFAAENPVYPPNTPKDPDSGCTAPTGTLVALIDAQGVESSSMYPRFEHSTW
jgi:phospholipase C